MIKLYVEDYCQECKEFNPEVEMIFADDCCSTTFITCRWAEHCNYIRNRIDRDLKVSKNEEAICMNCKHLQALPIRVCELCDSPVLNADENRCTRFEADL